MHATDPPPAASENPPLSTEVLAYATPGPAQALSVSARCSRIALISTICWIPATILAGLAGQETAGMTLLVGVPVFALVLSIVAANLGDGEAGDRRRSTRSLVYAGMACAMVLVFSILLPSIGKPREKANQIKCGSNLRQIGQGIQMYANDHKGQFPATFEQLISDQEFTTEVFICPSSNDDTASGATTRQTLIDFAKPGHCSYIYLGRGLTSAVSAQHVIAYEPLSNHQNLGINVMYGDGHVDWLNKAEAEYLVGQLGAGNNPPKKR